MAGGAATARPGKGLQDVIPLYFRIFLVLERRIREGTWPAGEPLPGEQDLAADFGVSRVTVRTAMALLEEAGLITRHRGRGTFVHPAALAPAAAAPGIGGFAENIRDFAQTTTVDLLEFAEVALPDALLPLAGAETRALRIRRTRRKDGVPFSYSVAHVLYPEAQLLSAATLGNRTVIAALEDAGFAFARADQRLTARVADAAIAGHLGLPVGAPLIVMRRAVFDRHSRLVEHIEICYDPAAYEYRVELSRESGGGQPPRWVQKD